MSGLVVFILGITGCIYAFIDEIKSLVYRQRTFVEVPEGGRRLPMNVIRGKAQTAIGQGYLNSDGLLYASCMEYFYRIYVDPYKIENFKLEFFNTVVNLHINLLSGGENETKNRRCRKRLRTASLRAPEKKNR